MKRLVLLLVAAVVVYFGVNLVRLFQVMRAVDTAPAAAPKVADSVVHDAGADDPEPSCDSKAMRDEYAASRTSMAFEDWCPARLSHRLTTWRLKRLPTASAATLCGWNSPYFVAVKYETLLPESDAFLKTNRIIDEVGAESLSWVLNRWRNGDAQAITAEAAAFRRLGLEPYAVLLEKAKGALKDEAQLGTLNAEWEALEKQRLYATWFERGCPQLATCAPR
jgi:hypothetical protein